MYYKYDLHVHSSEMSRCSKVDMFETADEFIEAGYSGFVLVNHFNTDTVYNKFPDLTWEELAQKTLDTYSRLKEKTAGKIQVFFGLEIAFPEAHNDYLVYGLTEKTIFDLVKFAGKDGIFGLGPDRLYQFTRSHGLVLIAAHPFRPKMLVTYPDSLDGYEVFNGCTRHNSSNDIALAWARKYGKIMTSGSDHHWAGDVKNAGIATEQKIEDQGDLARVLLSGNYKIIYDGKIIDNK